MKKNIALIGGSGHGEVVAEVALCRGIGLIGFYDDNVEARVSDLEHLGGISRFSENGCCILAVGDNSVRQAMAAKLPNHSFATLVHPSAVIASDVQLGEGTVVMAGAVINPGCRVGRHCVINTGAVLDHDCVMADFSSIGPGSTIGGGVRIGRQSFVGIGATVIHRIAIGEGVLLGAGAVLVRDLPDRVLAMGVPARIVRERAGDERYL